MAVRLAVLGLGRGAMLTVSALAAHPGIEIVAGCDPNQAARDGFGGECFAEAEDLMAWGGFDAVYVASPHEYHAAHAVMAARAGKHVLVEKPMAVSLAEAAAMVRVAEDAGTVLMVGPSHGYDPPVELAARLIEDGTAGPLRLIHSFAFTDFLYRPRRAAELDTAQGGGVVFSQATHQIDMARRLAMSPVASVRAWTGGWGGRGSEVAFTALLSFASGAAASLTYSGMARYDSDALAGWVGELGAAKQPRAHARTRAALAQQDEAGAKAARTFAAGWPQAQPPAHHEHLGSLVALCERADLELTPDGLILHGDEGPRTVPAPLAAVQRWNVADAFVRAVEGSAAPLLDGHWGLESLAVCHAILRSAREGRDVAPADLLTDLS